MMSKRYSKIVLDNLTIRAILEVELRDDFPLMGTQNDDVDSCVFHGA